MGVLKFKTPIDDFAKIDNEIAAACPSARQIWLKLQPEQKLSLSKCIEEGTKGDFPPGLGLRVRPAGCLNFDIFDLEDATGEVSPREVEQRYISTGPADQKNEYIGAEHGGQDKGTFGTFGTDLDDHHPGYIDTEPEGGDFSSVGMVKDCNKRQDY